MEDSGLVEDVDDFAGEALELVVEVVGEMVDALVGALDAAADLGEVLGVLEAELVELGADLAQEFFEFLLEGGAALEVVDDLEEDEEDGGERGGVDEPAGKMRWIGGGDFLRKDEGRSEKEEVGEIHFARLVFFAFYLLPSAFSPCCGGVAKDLSAIGGKVSGAGAGVEAEEGEGVEVGLEVVKLLTFGVGKVDKDPVLQAAKAQIDSAKAASEEVVAESLDVGLGLGLGGVESAGLGLVEKVIDEVDELAGGSGEFGDHGRKKKGERVKAKALRTPPALVAPSVPFPFSLFPDAPAGPPRGEARGDGSVGSERPGNSSGAVVRATTAGFHRSTG